MVDARVSLNNYSNRVLGVIKAKYDLKDKSAALNKFVELYGSNEVEPEVKDSHVKKILELEEAHYRKYGNRKMKGEELGKLFGK